MIGNEEDFTACLGFEVEGVDENIGHLPEESFRKMIQTAVSEFPNFKVAATTLRGAKSASLNEWSALVWHDGAFHEPVRKFQGDDILEILDRVGGGDSFVVPSEFFILVEGRKLSFSAPPINSPRADWCI